MKNFHHTSNNKLNNLIPGIALCFFMSLNISHAQVRVDADGAAFSSAEDHQSWGTATSDLQAAINALSDAEGGTIWIAEGTYVPTELYSAAKGPSESDPRNASFVIRSNVTIIGGFDGHETTLDQRPEDKFSNSNTVYLSGNIDLSDGNEGNSYHVVIFPYGVKETAVLQDLVITKGNANGPKEHFANRGGGVHARSGGVLKNCIITNNFADQGGGGAYLYKGALIENCTIYNNKTNQFGGGVLLNRGGEINNSVIHSNEAGPTSGETDGLGGGVFLESDGELPVTVTHSIIAGNYSNNKGGGIALTYGGHLINNVITNNKTDEYGGGLYIQDGGIADYNTIVANKSGYLGGGVYGIQNSELLENPELHNSVLWGNTSKSKDNQQIDRYEKTTTFSYCAIQEIDEATGLTNIINLDPENSGDGTHPEFGKVSTFMGIPETQDQVEEMLASDYRISLKSSLLNAGNSESSGLTVPQSDLTPNARIVKDTVDIGAYETLYYNLNASIISGNGSIDPSGSFDFLPDEDILFTTIPETGWKITSFMINSEDYTDQLVEEESRLTYMAEGISEDLNVNVEFEVANSLNDHSEEKLKVFPVPAEKELFLQGVKAKTLKIFDLNGKLVKELKENIGDSINLSDIKKGMYLLVLEDENKQSYSSVFIKK